MRKKDDTLRAALLDAARGVADTEGIDAVNIRSIAQKAGVATGTVYNYFSNKDEILLALTEEYWKQTLLEMNTAVAADSFCKQLEEIFAFLKERIDCSAGKLMGSLGNVETVGQRRMASTQEALEKAFTQSIKQDTAIRKDVWNDAFPIEQFARFVLMNMIQSLRTKAPDIRFLIEIVKRTIYKEEDHHGTGTRGNNI